MPRFNLRAGAVAGHHPPPTFSVEEPKRLFRPISTLIVSRAAIEATQRTFAIVSLAIAQKDTTTIESQIPTKYGNNAQKVIRLMYRKTKASFGHLYPSNTHNK